MKKIFSIQAGTMTQTPQPPPQQGFRTWPDETVSIHGLNTIESEIFRANNRMRLPNAYNGIVGELLNEFGGEQQKLITDASSSSSVSQQKFGERMVASVTNITNNHSSNGASWLTMTDASSAMMASQPQQPPTLPPAPPPRGGGIPSGASPPPSGPTPRHPGRVRQLVRGTGRTIGKSLKVGGAIGGLVVGVNIISHVKTSREVDDFFADENNNHARGDEKRGPSPSSTLVDTTNESKKRKRHVLVLPFENLKVIEHRANTTSLFDNLRTRLTNPDAAETTTIELRDLLRVIHSAATNPNVVALHANFGEGTPSYPLERGHGTEIRDAIRIFNESHRYHHAPNIHGSIRVGGNDGMPLPKYSHAFGHSYDFNTYYLASSCSYVHLQSRGYLNLFGNTASNVFLGGMLTKYGITAHVFKHGQYKNAPSILTQSKYSKSHLENVASMISSLNSTMCTQIEESRRRGNSSDATTKSSSLLSLDDDMPWQKIFNHGSLTATNSADIGLVDTIPPLDPVNVLMDMNKSASLDDDAREKKKTRKMTTMSTMWESLLASLGLDGAGSTTHPPTPAHAGRVDGSSSIGSERSVQEQERVGAATTTGDSDGSDDITGRAKKFEEKFGIHRSYSQFTANESITLSKYLGMLNKKDTVERTRRTMDDVLHRLSVSSTATSMILSALGLQTVDDVSSDDAKYNSDCDKIAVLTVDGGIDRKCSTRVVRALREIKTDKRVKAVVLRVNSPGGSVVSSELILEEIKHLDKPVICSMSNSAASGGYYISMNSEKIYANPTTITGSIGVFGIKFDASKLANDYGITTDEYPRGSHASTLNPLTPLTPDTKDNITRIIQDYYDYFKSIVSTGRSLSLDDVEKVAQGRVWTGEQAKEVGLVDAIGGLDRAVSYAKKTHATTEHVEVDYYPKKLSLMEQLGLGNGPVVSYVDVLQASVAVMIGFTGGCIEPGSTLNQFLGELTNVKIAATPHYMMTVDEETALDVILKGE